MNTKSKLSLTVILSLIMVAIIGSPSDAFAQMSDPCQQAIHDAQFKHPGATTSSFFIGLGSAVAGGWLATRHLDRPLNHGGTLLTGMALGAAVGVGISISLPLSSPTSSSLDKYTPDQQEKYMACFKQESRQMRMKSSGAACLGALGIAAFTVLLVAGVNASIAGSGMGV